MANSLSPSENGKVMRTVLTEMAKEGYRYAPVGVSMRHVHLSQAHLETLFGSGYHLHPLRDLVQPGQFAAEETVTLEGPKGRMEKVRIIGPVRKETQVELSITDGISLGIRNLPVRMSGQIAATPGIRVMGPAGAVTLDHGVIAAARHLHLNEEQAKAFKVHDGEEVSVRIGGERPGILEHVICRTGKGHELEFHVDTDEANAFLLKNGDYLEVLLPGETGKAEASDPFDGERIARKAVFALTGQKREYAVYSCMQTEPVDQIGRDNVLDLVTEQDIDIAAREGKGAVYCSRKALITPAAYDRSSALHVEIIRAEDSRSGMRAAKTADADGEVLELVTANDLNAAFRDDKKVLYCTPHALITPAAKERIAETGIRIVRLQ